MKTIIALFLTLLIAGAAVAQQIAEVHPAINDSRHCDTQSIEPDEVAQSDRQVIGMEGSGLTGESLREKTKWDTFAFKLSRSTPAKSVAIWPSTKLGESESGQQAKTPRDSSELAKQLSNPVASLISFPLQSNVDFHMGTGSGWRYTLNVQPVIPIALGPKWNMISRTIIPIIHQGNVTAPHSSENGLGDTVQSLFFSPNKVEPFIWAVGPVALLPTATNGALGQGKWGLGPTALVLKQTEGGWTYGMLANHVWSVGGQSSRKSVSATFVQPFLAYNTKDGWTYNLNTESTYDWKSKRWAVPIHFTISKLVLFGKQPVSFGAGLRCWATTPKGGAEGCGLRIIVTALFPKG
jgi:hypothetical protein